MITDKFLKYNLILGSKSPRRQMLLKGLDFNFQVIVKSVKEDYPEGMPVAEVPEYLSRQKAGAYDMNKFDRNTILITSDTVVIHQGKIVTKPESLEDAKTILRRLSGNRHTVITGVCLTSLRKQHSFSAHSEVFFRHIQDEDIRYYVEKYRPLDKAGAYGIQEWIGYVAIEKIEGSFYNVMGLPTQMLYEELQKFVKSLKA